MKNFFAITLILASTLITKGQVFPFTEVGFELNGDSILHIAAADLEGSDGQDIFLTVAGSDGVFYLTPKSQGSADFSLQKLKDVDMPVRIFGAHLNGAGFPDLLFSSLGKTGMGTLHGEDEDNSAGKNGTRFENDGLTEPQGFTSLPFISGNTSRFINTHFFQLDDRNLSIWTSASSSFNIIAPSFIEENSYAFDIAAISSINAEDKIGHLYLIDGQTGDIHLQVLNYPQPWEYVMDENTTIIAQASGARACKTIELDDGSQYLFVLTSDELIRYAIDDNYSSTAISIDMENPTNFAMGNFDNNDSLDIVIQDGQNIWLLPNGVGRSTQELILETDLIIKELVAVDINHDDIADIVYTMKNSPDLNIIRNDKLTSIDNVSIVIEEDVLYPNPTNGDMHVAKGWEIKRVFNAQGQELSPSTIQNDFGHFNSGIYFVEVYKGDIVFKVKVVKL